MFEPIQANYTPDGDDWTIEVTLRGKTLKDTAPGLIAARDRADQLAEKIAPNEDSRTVVHMLEGDAVNFTAAYLTARLGTEPKPAAPADEAGKKTAPSAMA
ncbi:hypothetical protein [Actinokineospora sp. HUAS TT18]|uniref:hypothetical protein n=1 Tax=Actinokineospora sp. HUAS TT18 TaxID=3447451 RepID=UPI003F522F5D